MTAYYNEYDKKKAAVLRELIRQDVIAPGVVDERSILDVRPDELRGFTQVHLCAGFGVWSYALRAAGWSDNDEVWSVSEPCQPHSAAGKMLGDADERYLRWAIHHHVEHGKGLHVPVLGEQVANGDGLAWLDTLSADMEGAGHTVRGFDLCSAGFGSPNIRQRLYWLAYAEGVNRRAGLQHASARCRCGEHGDSRNLCGLGNTNQNGSGRTTGNGHCSQEESAKQGSDDRPVPCIGSAGSLIGLADANCGNASPEWEQCGWQQRQQQENGGIGILGNAAGGRRRGRRYAAQPGSGRHANCAGDLSGGVGNAGSSGLERHGGDGNGSHQPGWLGAAASRSVAAASISHNEQPGPVNGFWRDADWLFCRDGKWRPVRPGSFPLVTGAAARVLRLRGYGDAINAEVATAWARIVRECLA